MTKAKDFAKVWSDLSQRVLACVLVDDGAVFPVNDIIASNTQWFAHLERPIWDAVQVCLSENTIPTVEAVITHVNGDVPAGHIKAIAGLFNDEDNRHLIYNVEQLRSLGVMAEIRDFGRELAGIDQIDDITKVADKISTKLGGILSGASRRDSAASTISNEAWQMVEKAQEPGIPTGLKWFDDQTGGLWSGMNYWIVAPYKDGKTTVMRNCVLHSASYGYPVGVFCAEGSREMFALDCQAMLATQILMDGGRRGSDLRLSGLFLRRFYWVDGVLTNEEFNAINEARTIWDGLPIHIWDTKDGIRNLSTLRYLVKRGRVHHGLRSFWADYSQLFGEGNIFERQSSVALTIQDIAQSENVAFGMLAQKNEEGVKGGSASHSPNVKGGGDAPAAADFLLIPKRSIETDGLMELTLKLSRFAKPSMGQHWIAPASGLIIDKYKTGL